VDALFLGPGDLSAAMGRLGDIGNTEVQRMIARAAELARGAGKPIGIVGPNPDMVRRFLAYGYSYVAVGSDLSMMTGRAGEWMSALARAGRRPVAGERALLRWSGCGSRRAIWRWTWRRRSAARSWASPRVARR
jgi:hypothetical protein